MKIQFVTCISVKGQGGKEYYYNNNYADLKKLLYGYL